jgi:hypothetical protein
MKLADYLKSRMKIIILVAGLLLVFFSAYFLFDMPLITVLYPLILSAFILIVVGTVDYILVRKKHMQLSFQESLPEELTDFLPESASLIEQDYQLIIEKLKEEEKVSRNQVISDYNNMVEYYTIWAHQIKTPIASMRLTLQSDDSELSRKIQADLVRVEEYVEMVLTFLRLDSDSTDYLIKEVELDEMIRTAIRKFKSDFIQKKLSVNYEPLEAKVLTDEKWLSFVIEQIISNAVKYTTTGGISISLSEDKVLCVEDSGIGINPEDLPRIFENGYTGFNGREQKEASGIGLYLCRRICENLGHKIWAESTPGEGTKIYLDLSTDPLGVE